MSRIKNPFSMESNKPTEKEFKPLYNDEDIIVALEKSKVGALNDPRRLATILNNTYYALYR